MTGNNRGQRTRRTVLGAAGSVAAAGLAGCVGGDSDSGNESGTDSPDDTGEADSGGGSDTTATVTLLAESTSPHEDGLPDDNISHACEHFEFGDSEDLTGAESPDGAPEISATHQLFDVTVEGENGHVVFHGGEGGHDHGGEGGDGHEGGHEGEDGHDHGGEGEDGHDHGGEGGDGHEGEDGHDHGGEGEDGHEGGHEGEDEGGHDHGGEAYAFFADGGSVSVVEGNTVHAEDGDVSACGPADMYLIAEPAGEEIVLALSA
jgi:hypothetical protein